MVLGSGLLAKTFSLYANNDDVIIFASGVSNSQETQKSAFKREHDLLLEVIQKNPEKILVYFSTCSLYDSSVRDMPYVKHKKMMEDIIQKSIKNHYIFRLSHVVGKTNSPTIINFLQQKITNKEEFELWENSDRNLIADEDVYKIIDYILKNNLYLNETINIASPHNTSIKKIVAKMEEILDTKSSYVAIQKGERYIIDTSLIEAITSKANVDFHADYVSSILKKYLLRR